MCMRAAYENVQGQFLFSRHGRLLGNTLCPPCTHDGIRIVPFMQPDPANMADLVACGTPVQESWHDTLHPVHVGTHPSLWETFDLHTPSCSSHHTGHWTLSGHQSHVWHPFH